MATEQDEWLVESSSLFISSAEKNYAVCLLQCSDFAL